MHEYEYYNSVRHRKYLIIIIIIQKICSTHISTLLGAQGANPETPISALGYFTGITQHTETTASRPIRRTKQLSVLLKDTSAATGQAVIRTHILTTPELESDALDRSATTLPHLNPKHPMSPRFATIISPCTEISLRRKKLTLSQTINFDSNLPQAKRQALTIYRGVSSGNTFTVLTYMFLASTAIHIMVVRAK